MRPPGMDREPRWTRVGWLPTLDQVAAPVLAGLRGEHDALAGELEAACRDLEETYQREAPADPNGRAVWTFNGGEAGNRPLNAAKARRREAALAVCGWVDAFLDEGGFERLNGEMTLLSARVATNDEVRRPDVRRLGAFVLGFDARGTRRDVERVRRAMSADTRVAA